MEIADKNMRDRSVSEEERGALMTQPDPGLVKESAPNRIPIMIRVDPDILARIDHAAKRLGISRSAFLVVSAAEKLERFLR
jgi:hypothetical protein